jgi:hypothetical protein
MEVFRSDEPARWAPYQEVVAVKKTLVFGAATAAVALSLGTCWNPMAPVETVYGPPPEETDSQDPAVVTPEEGEVDEPVADLYGPPVEETDASVDDIEMDEVIVPALYGPPPESATAPEE